MGGQSTQFSPDPTNVNQLIISYVHSPMNCGTMGRFFDGIPPYSSLRSCNIGCYYSVTQSVRVWHIAGIAKSAKAELEEEAERAKEEDAE